MSNENPSTAFAVACRECGALNCKITKGLCPKHYKHQWYRAMADARGVEPHSKISKDEELRRRRERYKANREAILKAQKAYGVREREGIIQRQRARRSAMSAEVLAEQRRRSYLKHRDKRIGEMREYTAKNRDRLLAQRRAHRRENSAVIRARAAARRAAGLMRETDKRKKATRRAAKRNAGGTHTVADLRQMMGLQRGKCAVCREDIRRRYHVDHVVPLARGGSNDRLNLQLLCPGCNQEKHDKDPVAFMQSLGFLL